MIHFKIRSMQLHFPRLALMSLATLPLALLPAVTPANGVEVTFEIDPEQSFLVSSAFVKSVGAPTSPQGDGADFASFSGFITLDMDDVTNPAELRFVRAEAIAGISGDWLPENEGGTEGNPGDAMPANFGIYLDAGAAGQLFGAFRETVFTIESEDLPVVDGLFDSSQSFVTSQGYLDSNIISVALGNSFGRDDATGDNALNISTETGSYSVAADSVVTLTIPVDLDFLSSSETGVDFFFGGMLIATYGMPSLIPGDANGDGRVDAADLNIIGLNWQGVNKSRAEGDFTGDGIVNAADLNVLGVNWQTGVAAAVPEPNGLKLSLLVSTLALVILRRSKS